MWVTKQAHLVSAVLALAQTVLGHGYLSFPKARNFNDVYVARRQFIRT
jgi:predicted carbohydrate-binding protein with CBM5 and CBM33 domain